MANSTFASAKRLGSFQSGRSLNLRGTLTPDQRSDFFAFRFTSRPSSGLFASTYSFSTRGGSVAGQLFLQQGRNRRLVSQFSRDTLSLPRLQSGRYLLRLTAVPTTLDSTGEISYSFRATLN